LVVTEKIRVLEPNDFYAAKERQRLQRLDGRSYSRGGLLGVIGGAIDDL